MKTNEKRSSSKHRKGAITVLAALFLIVVLAFLAFSIDFGYITVTASELQNAADAGVLSGARALPDGRDAAIAAAQLWASKNVAAGKSVATVASDDIEIGVWDDGTAKFTALTSNSNETPNAVRMTCRRTSARGNSLKLFFAPIIGTNSTDLVATATARIKSFRCGLIIGISSVSMSGGSHTNSYNAAVGPYNAAAPKTNGHVCSNGDIVMSGSSAINGDAHPGNGHVVKSSSSIGVLGKISPLNKSLAYSPADLGDTATNNSNLSIPLSQNNKKALDSKRDFVLSGGDSVKLPPGKYYFNKMSLSGGSSIIISGPTEIYATGDVSLSGGSMANLTMLPKNLQLFPMGSKCVLSGDSEFCGVVYNPTAKVERSGDSDFYGAIVAGQLVLSGSGGIHADESLDSQLLKGGAKGAKLLE